MLCTFPLIRIAVHDGGCMLEINERKQCFIIKLRALARTPLLPRIHEYARDARENSMKLPLRQISSLEPRALFKYRASRSPDFLRHWAIFFSMFSTHLSRGAIVRGKLLLTFLARFSTRWRQNFHKYVNAFNAIAERNPLPRSGFVLSYATVVGPSRANK